MWREITRLSLYQYRFLEVLFKPTVKVEVQNKCIHKLWKMIQRNEACTWNSHETWSSSTYIQCRRDEYCLRTASKLHRTPLETRDSNYRKDEAIVQCTHHVCGAALSTLPLELCRLERPHSCPRSAAPDYLPVLFRFWRGGGPGSSLLCARPSRRGSVAHPPEISNVAKSETETKRQFECWKCAIGVSSASEVLKRKLQEDNLLQINKK